MPDTARRHLAQNVFLRTRHTLEHCRGPGPLTQRPDSQGAAVPVASLQDSHQRMGLESTDARSHGSKTNSPLRWVHRACWPQWLDLMSSFMNTSVHLGSVKKRNTSCHDDRYAKPRTAEDSSGWVARGGCILLSSFLCKVVAIALRQPTLPQTVTLLRPHVYRKLGSWIFL